MKAIIQLVLQSSINSKLTTTHRQVFSIPRSITTHCGTLDPQANYNPQDDNLRLQADYNQPKDTLGLSADYYPQMGNHNLEANYKVSGKFCNSAVKTVKKKEKISNKYYLLK